MTNISIALNKLTISPLNVRKTHGKSTFAELKASILAHGLLNNLVVTQADRGLYYVVAGGRRLAAMHELQKEGKLPKDHGVPCHLRGDGDASEASLAENTVREAMHPADEFEAFATLTKDHKPVDIAARFGVTERHVLQRLKLGKLAPEILKDFRADKLKLEALMAYTLTDDHNAQRKVYKAQNGYHHAHSIKRLLTENKAEADSKLARFVGLAAYEKAGGKITGDLFGEGKYLDDATLLQKLANEKLAAKAEKLNAEGWGWIETALESNYGFTSKCDEIEARPTDAPKKLLDKQAKLSTEYDKVEAEWNAADDEDDDAYDKVNAKLDKLRTQLEEVETELEEYKAFEPKEMETAGCYVTIDHDGKISVRRGLVKPEDKKAVAKGKGDVAGTEKTKEKGFSQSLIDSLKQHRLQIAQAALSSDIDVAFDLLVFKAACDKFTNSHIHSGPDVSFSRNHFRSDMVTDAKHTVAGKALMEAHERLKLDWLKEKTETAKFSAFGLLSQASKIEILAYCTAGTLQAQLAQSNAFETALGLTEVDVAEYWRPTADNYLSKITRDQLLEVGREIFSKAWADKWASAKKGDLVKELDRAFKDPAKFAGNKETEQKLHAWLPEGMAFTAPEKKAKAKKKAA